MSDFNTMKEKFDAWWNTTGIATIVHSRQSVFIGYKYGYIAYKNDKDQQIDALKSRLAEANANIEMLRK